MVEGGLSEPNPTPVGPSPLLTNSEVADAQAPLDSMWYEKLVEIGRDDKDTPDSLAGDKESREAQKQSFLIGEIRNPVLEIPNIDLESLRHKEASLLELKSNILSQEQNELVRQVYRWRINERIASIRMLRAAKEGKMRTFKHYAEFIYGKPSEEVFAYTLSSLRERISRSLESDDTSIKDAATELLSVLPSFREPNQDHSVKAESFDRAKEQTTQELGPMLQVEEFEGKLGGEELRQVFESALDTLGISELHGGSWRVVVDDQTDGKVMSVDQMSQVVRMPAAASYSHKELVKWLAHEIGTHVLRRRNGERTKLMLLGIGLDRYEGGEEGVATMREQVVSTESLDDFAGLRYHLVASLALGLDGQPRDFRDTFSILEKYHIYNYMSKGRSREKATKLGRSLAYNDCVRLYRGTDCGPGVVMTKDIAYRESNMGVYELIGSDNGVQEMMRFSVGKYDPMNPRHIWILDQLGVTEEDLVELDHEQDQA